MKKLIVLTFLFLLSTYSFSQKFSKQLLKDIIYEEDTFQLSELIKEGLNPEEAFFAHKNTLIHYALYEQKLDFTGFLIRNGVPCEIKNKIGFTALDLVVINRNYALLNLMLDKGCNPSVVGYMGGTAIMHILFNMHYSRNIKNEYAALKRVLTYDKNINYSCDQCGHENYLMQCVSYADTIAAKMLMDHEIQINARDDKGMTALHYAVKLNKSEFVSFLIKHGASVNIKNNKGKTALDLAEKKNYNEIILLLKSIQ